ncbi:MAG: hypothetical protein KY456_06405 [Chloroflexi bacterium]|nr:hypothetical protein [Chloroflexota bacterium]
MCSRPILAAVLVTLLLVWPQTGHAQVATPTGSGGEAIDPAECRVEPVPVEELIEMWYPRPAAGMPEPSTPEADTAMTSVSLPLGEPADAAIVTEITATVRQLFACQNRAENGRFYALFTADMLRGFGPPPDTTPEDISAHVAPYEPIPVGEYIRLLAVTDVSLMADGRVSALVVSDDPPIPPDGPETMLMIFVEVEDR